MAPGKTKGSEATPRHRDPYEVLNVSKDSSDQEIKMAYRKLALNPIMISAGELESGNAGEFVKLIKQRYHEAVDIIAKGKMCCLFINDLNDGAGRMGGTTQYTVNNQMVNATLMNIVDNPTNVQLPGMYNKQENAHVSIIITRSNFSTLYHPDKNASNPEASELFKEVAYSYSILSDPEKRRQYDSAGFEALENEGMEMEIDLSNLGTVNTVFAALFSKLGVPIKTTVSANVLEEALSGTVTIRPLKLGSFVNGKVEKQNAHFYGVTIGEEQAQSGIVVRVSSAAQSKFKLLYFEQEATGGYGLALQEDSEKTGKVTSAGMYFLHFQVYRLDSTINTLAMAKDPETTFFKRLEGLQPCEVSELKPGTHIFAVYGDNFFKPASYTIEALSAKPFEDVSEKLKQIEGQILAKRTELRQFELEYRKALAHFQEVTNRYSQEKQAVDDLLKERDNIHSLFTNVRAAPNPSGSSSSSNGKVLNENPKVESSSEDEIIDAKDRSSKKKWFNLNLSRSEKKS